MQCDKSCQEYIKYNDHLPAFMYVYNAAYMFVCILMHVCIYVYIFRHLTFLEPMLFLRGSKKSLASIHFHLNRM